jgi:hypothetical protein
VHRQQHLRDEYMIMLLCFFFPALSLFLFTSQYCDSTEAVEQTTYSPVFDYKHVHHVPNVTEDFLKSLHEPLEMHIHVTQHINRLNVSSFFAILLPYKDAAADSIAALV